MVERVRSVRAETKKGTQCALTNLRHDFRVLIRTMQSVFTDKNGLLKTVTFANSKD